MRSITAVVILLFWVLTVSDIQAEIYSWTDEKGVKHYSHTPPPEREVPFESAPEIKPDPAVAQKDETINEANVEKILKELDQEEAAPVQQKDASKKPPSPKNRIEAEAEKLREKIAFLEQLPPDAYANDRSKQAIIGRYQYRLQQLYSDPDAYFTQYGN